MSRDIHFPPLVSRCCRDETCVCARVCECMRKYVSTVEMQGCESFHEVACVSVCVCVCAPLCVSKSGPSVPWRAGV